MKKLQVVLLVLMAVMVLGCSNEPTLDGSSEEAFKASAEKMIASVDDAKKKSLQEAVAVVVFAQLNLKKMVQDMSAGIEPKVDKIYKEMDGMTADDIIKRSKEIIAERKAKK
ncbi:DUF6694 family lipoprotein [Maridesulfovibrio zosterae]|uniref:DUF6694 family lipoprotein n=1 Tax=Maridesulfovibrio zosterae TaxID=82171 RepID=UPI00040624DC|nr:DUF6694 family lipoprotein [Maridesulfovibrio zosterae]